MQCNTKSSDCIWYDEASAIDCSRLKNEECDNSEMGCIWEPGNESIGKLAECKPIGKCALKDGAKQRSRPYICCSRSAKQQKCYDKIFNKAFKSVIIFICVHSYR